MTTEINKSELIGQEQKLHSAFTVDKAASADLGEGEFVAVISTGSLDRHGEHVDPKGGTVPNRTIRMYFNHMTWGETLPIGSWLKIWLEGGKWMGHGKIDLADDFERKIYAKVLSGTLDSISIGFIPKMYDVESDTWTEWELSEASIVNEPANPEARITSKSALAEVDEALKVKLKADFIETGEHKTEDEVVEPPVVTEPNTEDGSVDADMNAAVEELKSKVGALEEAHRAANDSQSVKSVIKVRMAGKEVDKAAETLNQIIKVKLKGTK